MRVSGSQLTVHDVAAFVLRECGRMSTKKLQKLSYYGQAWALVRLGRPLFPDDFQAWVEGPVCPALYGRHRGQFHVSAWPGGDCNALMKEEEECLRRVLRAYGDKSGAWLGDMTHREAPWKEARVGLESGARSSKTIEKETMQNYYAVADTLEARIVLGGHSNPIFDFIETMSEDEASLLEALAERDLLDPINEF